MTIISENIRKNSPKNLVFWLNLTNFAIEIKKIRLKTTKDTMNALVITPKEAQRALVIASRTNAITPAELLIAGAKAAMVAELKKRMQTSVVEFYFVKKSTGELRHAYGTTMSSLAANHINGRGISRDSVNTIAFWDVEKGGWRSFRYETLVKVC